MAMEAKQEAAATSPAREEDAAQAKTQARAEAEKQAETRVRALLRDLRVDTGDVVLFDRKCASMGLYGGAICVCAKFFGHTQWDHNGVVVRVPSEDESVAPEDELFLLEAALTGVKLRPLVPRILRSRGHEVAVRKLQVARTPELQAQALQFALGSLDSPYEDNPARFFNAGVAVPTRIARERIFDALVATKKQLARLDAELSHRDKMPPFERKALLREHEQVNARYQALGAELRGRERSVFENAVIPPSDQAEAEDGKPRPATKMFCSQLVAGLYQHLGLLLPYPAANSYLPKHFSERDGGDYLKLQQDASFLPEVSLRKALDRESERYAQRAQDAKERAPRAGHETATLVRCLRRHQLFHTLSEPELVEAAGKFRRRALAPGEVVFYQGSPGDFFYVVERGDCDVFVDYDHLLKTHVQPAETETETRTVAGDKDVAERVKLRKRKTIALPEFQSSSRLVGKNERVLVATNGPGNAFGESALIYDTPRRATLQASGVSSSKNAQEEAVVLWQLDKRAFRELVAQHPGSQQSLEERRFLLETLEDHPLFAELDDRAKALAVRKCFPLKVRAGTTILRQGDSGDYFYLVETGKCEVSRRKPQAQTPFVDRVIGRGASFGEAALLYNSRRGASVRALEDAKIWCMDRASFLTITRSGSTALHKLFQKVGTTVVPGATESFATEKDLRRMLSDPQQLQLVRHSANEDEADDQAFDVKPAAVHEPLPEPQAYDRAVKLALALLLNDASGLVNFSQFAHFHIALGASNMDQLLPEAAFRVLKTMADEDEAAASPQSSSQDGADQAAIMLKDLPRALQRWGATSEAAKRVTGPQDAPETSTSSLSPSRLAFYERLFELPSHQLGDQYITHDDLVRGIAAFEDGDVGGYSDGDDQHAEDPDVAVAKREFHAFLTALKADINALRTIWHAAELQAHGSDADVNNNQQALTFDANLKSGWISAMRHNPTGGDWEYLQPQLEGGSATYDNGESFEKQQLAAQATSFAAAIAAGGLARTACAPLERLKLLMQLPTPKPTSAAARATAQLFTQGAPYTSLTRGLLNMVKLSGARSLYSGNLAHCLWVVPSLPTKFLLCDVYRDQLSRLLPEAASPFRSVAAVGNKKPRMSPDMANLLIGGLAGLTANCLFYPLDVVRGRLSAQQYYSAERRSATGILDCARSIREKEGLRAFYKGFAPASLGVFAYIGCNFAIYESLRPVFVLYDTEDTSNQLGHPSIPGQILCATTASLASQCLSYPFDVVRRRVQLQGATWHPDLAFPTYDNAWHCVRASVQEEGGGLRGLRALYRGVFVNAVKALPSAVISFLSYEKLREMKHSADDA